MADIRTIAQGVRLCTVKTDRFKTSKFSVEFALPMTGNLSANALLMFVLKHSCAKYPDFVMLRSRLDELYGASVSTGVSKSGEAQVLTMSATCIDDRFALTEGENISAECAELLCSMLFSPDFENGTFRESVIAEEKRLLLQLMDEEINDKRKYANIRCEQLLCSGELYGKNKYGTREEVEAVTAADLYAAWQNMLKTARVMICSGSSADGSLVEQIFTDAFSSLDRDPAEITTEFRAKAGEFRRVEEKFPVNQGKLVMGFRTGMTDRNDGFAAEVLMNDIFGGNVYSKLFLNVREKLSLCYYCWAKLVTRKGIIFVDSGIDTVNEKKAADEILAQLRAVCDGDFTEDDMKASVMGMRERWLTMDEPSSICSWYASQVTDDVIYSPEERVAMLEKVTKEEICNAAKRMQLEAVYMISAEEEEK